ncbi:MAG: hypothetical protein WCQ26_03125 [Pseudanabaena sp. ELA748]
MLAIILQVLRESINSESIDLVYLDPPFNSNADYNVIFGGRKSGDAPPQAKITAFGVGILGIGSMSRRGLCKLCMM